MTNQDRDQDDDAPMDSLHRHRSLRFNQWIKEHYESTADYLKKVMIIDDKTGEKKEQNQGEISQLLNCKRPFGEKRARTIETISGMPKNYLDWYYVDENKAGLTQMPANTMVQPNIKIITPFCFWSDIDIFFQANGQSMLRNEMIYDLRELKYKVSPKAFQVKVDTDNFGEKIKKGFFLLINPPDEQSPRHGQTLIVSLLGQARKTLVQYYEVAGKVLLEPLEKGLPKSIEITSDDMYESFGYVILSGFVQAHD